LQPFNRNLSGFSDERANRSARTRAALQIIDYFCAWRGWRSVSALKAEFSAATRWRIVYVVAENQ
jgi:hypothetical protein